MGKKGFRVDGRDRRFQYQLSHPYTNKGELHTVTDQLKKYGDQEDIDYTIQEDLDMEDKKIFTVFVP